MNILELDSFNLSDAVKFHNRLNPKIWGADEHLLPEVKEKLLEIAADFQEFLGISDLDVQDITLSGSNAAYSYTPHSDIDLHLVVNVPKDEVYQELFNAKKYQYNDIHDIRIRGADVELYVQPADEPAVSLGEYSVKNDTWLEVPKRKRAKIDQTLVRHKYEDVKARIESALRDNDADRVQALIKKIKEMRQAGLDAHGEFGPENLAFKMLRKQGWIEKLYNHSAATKDRELSLKEQPKKPFKYGYGSDAPADASDYHALFKPAAPKEPSETDVQFSKPQDYEWFKKQQARKKELASEDAGSTWDGVNPTTCMVVNEEEDDEQIVHKFIEWAAGRLGIENLPEIFIHADPKWSVEEHSFGRYEPDSHSLHVNMANRHLFDILRTTAHELAHCKQNEVEELPHDAGETGSQWENDAHAAAGIIMREFADAHPELFDAPALQESASGYIPTKKQAKDPRFSMALSVDIKPGQVGKEANKMALDTDSQGKPAMIYQSVNQMHEDIYQELSQEFALLESEFISEISMRPTNLRQEAAKTGARAGMEFEMYVPGVGEVESDEQEPDMDSNERARSISDIRQFFHDGDYNGRRDVERLEQSLLDAYLDSDFLSEQKQEAWGDASYDSVKELVERDYEDELREQAQEEVLAQTDEFGTNAEELNAAVQERFDELFDAKVNEILADMGSEYDEAYEDWEGNDWQNQVMDWESEWLESEGLETMWDVAQNYDIQWPYWTSSGTEAERSVDEVAEEFSDAVGKPINVATRYHGARREAGHYVVEPDGSLDEPNEESDGGLEFVSPPMPIDELISDLNKVKKWADRNGCYTNESTGLHINISVPDYSLEKLDYIKLALLLGDKYVLDQFERAGNSYCKSAMGKIRDKIKAQPERAQEFLEKMRNGMGQLASKAIHSGTTDKYTSINTKDGYIEFRSPGGDWLDANFDKIENTLLRFTVALSAAIDPQAHREEYLKKFYKLLDVKGSGDPLTYFAKYAAGEMPKAALKSFIKQAQLQRKIEKDPTGGQQYWWEVSRPGYFASIQVVASSKEEAINKAIEPGNYPDWASAKNTLEAKPIKPFDSSPVRASVGAPQPVGQQSGTHTYRVFNIHNGQTIGTFQAGAPGSGSASQAFAELIAREGVRERDADYEVIGQERQPGAPIPGSTLDLQRQRAAQQQGAGTEYMIFNMNDRSQLTGFRAANQQAAEREAESILQDLGLDPDNYDVRPRHPQQTGDNWSQDFERRVSQPQQQPAPPTGAGREFAGWRVLLPTGEEVYRFSGVGNSQADANRIAAQWLRNNGMGVSGEGFEVVPVWNVAEAITRRGFLGTMGAAAAAAAAPNIAAAAGVKKPAQPTQPQAQPQQASGLGLKMPKEFNLLGNNPQNEITLQKTAMGSGLKGPELAQFLGQMKHESWNFEKMKEQPKGQNYFERRYGVQYSPKTASMLGNKYPGDGERYHGRGFVQLTGRENYRRAGEALGLDLLNQPDLAANPDIAAKIAVWYWNSRVRPRVKNFTDTASVTKAINPALRGLEDRDANFKDYMKLV